MCRQAISYEDKETNTKVYIIEIYCTVKTESVYSTPFCPNTHTVNYVHTFILQYRLLAQTRTFLSPHTVMVTIAQVNNLIVTFLLHPAKLLVQYIMRSLMKNPSSIHRIISQVREMIFDPV